MHVCLIAYSYNKEGRSEALTAYNLSKAIELRGHRTTIITARPADQPNVIQLKSVGLYPRSRYFRALQVGYFEFIGRAYQFVRKTLEHYDIVHHVSPISLRYPDPLCNLHKPFIWGPVGGSLPYPPGFASVSRKDTLLQHLRIFDGFRLRCDPMLRNTMSKASRIVVTSSAARMLLPSQYREKSIVIPEGLAETELSARADARSGIPGRAFIFSSGRLIPYKAMDLLIRAYAKSGIPASTPLWISGHGREQKNLEVLIRNLGLGERVRLLGKISRADNLGLMRESLFCVFPALNEAFGHVNLEAMSAGKAIIVSDWGGPADIVEEGFTGFKILASDPDLYIELLARRIKTLFDDAGLRERMGSNATRRVRELFSWSVIGSRYDELYHELVTVNGQRDPPSCRLKQK